MFVERKVSCSQCKQKIMSFRGQARRAKIISPGGKLTALACHLTKSVNKAEELIYLSTNIERSKIIYCCVTQGTNVCTTLTKVAIDQ
jgi:hypothetical protein